MKRGPVFVSKVVSYSLAYVLNLATALSALIQNSIVLINTVRKPSMEPIVKAMRRGITPEIVQK